MTTDTVTLACGCVVTADESGVHLQPVCAAHTADVQGLALMVSQDPVVQALIKAAGGPAPASDPTAFSYSGNPAASPLDNIRFMLGDTDGNKPRFTNGEIGAVYMANLKDVTQTCAALCDVLVARYTGWVNETVGSVSIGYGQLADNYRRLGDTLRMQLSRRSAPWAGGIDRFDARRRLRDPSLVQPRFRVGMFETPNGTYDLRAVGGGYRLDWSPPFYAADP